MIFLTIYVVTAAALAALGYGAACALLLGLLGGAIVLTTPRRRSW
jgi:hypothetical protein